MRALWRWVSLRHLLHEGGRTGLVLAGVALGVAVFVAIRLANHSAMASFADTVDAVAGKANLQVTADSGGFDQALLGRIAALPGVTAAAPVLQTYALADVGARQADAVAAARGEAGYTETLMVLGVDPLAEAPFGRVEASAAAPVPLEFLADPAAVAVTRAFAARHGLGLGAELPVMVTGVPRRLRVRLILDAPELQQAMGGNVAVMELAAAQRAFDRGGKLDRVDLLVEPARREAVITALRGLLPAQTRVGLPESRTRQVENMVRAFDMNLTALSFIALFVSMFLIFNAVSMAVLRRRREIGVLRSLGATRRQVVLLFLGEAAVLGLVGSAAGLALGTLLAKGALGAVARTITTLYLQVHAREVHLDAGIYAGGFALGVGISLLSALAPALEASLTPPNSTVRQGTLVEAQPLPLGRLTAVGLGLLLAAGAVAWLTVARRRPEGGFVSAFLLLGGFSLVAPGFTLLCERLARPLVERWGSVEAILGARYLREAVARTSVVVAALMVSVGMTIGLSVMVASFRRTVDVWVNQTIRGDLYVEPVGRRVTGTATVLPPRVVAAARGLPGVAAVDTYRGLEINVGDRMAHLAGIEFTVQRDRGRLLFLEGDTRSVLDRALREDGVIASESFVFRHGLRAGDRVALGTPSGRVELPISGVFYDYTTDAGLLMLDRALYSRLWREDRTESVALYLEPRARWEDARAELLRRAGPVALNVMPNQSLRSRILTIFDQTFQITYALHGIAILVAVLGVISTLTALILQRGREIGVLRGVGALRGQIRTMVLVESGLLGLIGSLLGCACGVCLALLLTYVINKQFFGWTIRLTVDPWLFVQAVGLMLGTALLAGLGPARLAAGRVAAEAMRVE
jgi:putative ABC transport system permease protein